MEVLGGLVAGESLSGLGFGGFRRLRGGGGSIWGARGVMVASGRGGGGFTRVFWGL